MAGLEASLRLHMYVPRTLSGHEKSCSLDSMDEATQEPISLDAHCVGYLKRTPDVHDLFPLIYGADKR